MKYAVTRTSFYSSNKSKPCEEAVQMVYENYRDNYGCKTIKKALKSKWLRGKKLKQMKGFVRVYEREKVWVIELNSLIELNDFTENYRSIVLSKPSGTGLLHEIEIYDSYRE